MIFTSVDLPAPFSPRRARIEPGAASRSTPWRTSTPPNDLRTPRTLRSAVMRSRTGARLLAGLGVDLGDVRRRDHLVVGVHVPRFLLALDQRDQDRDDPEAVELREVRRVVDPVLERCLAADVRPRRRVASLRADVDVVEPVCALRRLDGADRLIVVRRHDEQLVSARQAGERVRERLNRPVGRRVRRDLRDLDVRALRLDAGELPVLAVDHDLPGGRSVEGEEAVGLAVPRRLGELPEGLTVEVAGLVVVRAEEDLLTRRLVDVDRDRRDLRPGGADARRRGRVELEVRDPLDALRLELGGAVDRLLSVEVRIALDKLDAVLLCRLLDAVPDDDDERQLI